MDSLTIKEQRFVDEYMIDPNATQAAIRAGYAKSTARFASYWLNPNMVSKPYNRGQQYKPHVADAIKQRTVEIRDAKIADAEEVMEYLTGVMRGEEKDEKLVVTPLGVVVRETVRVQVNQVKAAELLAKRYGLTSADISVNNETVVIVEDLGDD